MTTTMTL